jgi:hypothetical protein
MRLTLAECRLLVASDALQVSADDTLDCSSGLGLDTSSRRRALLDPDLLQRNFKS